MAANLHYVKPLDPETDRAWRARADVFFAECLAANAASAAARIEAILAAEAAAAPVPMRRAA